MALVEMLIILLLLQQQQRPGGRERLIDNYEDGTPGMSSFLEMINEHSLPLNMSHVALVASNHHPLSIS